MRTRLVQAVALAWASGQLLTPNASRSYSCPQCSAMEAPAIGSIEISAASGL